jgi:hypothetical protein
MPEPGTGGITFLEIQGGTTMLALIAFFAVVVLLVVMLGLPYPQSWYGRWGNSDR